VGDGQTELRKKPEEIAARNIKRGKLGKIGYHYPTKTKKKTRGDRRHRAALPRPYGRGRALNSIN